MEEIDVETWNRDGPVYECIPWKGKDWDFGG